MHIIFLSLNIFGITVCIIFASECRFIAEKLKDVTALQVIFIIMQVSNIHNRAWIINFFQKSVNLFFW